MKTKLEDLVAEALRLWNELPRHRQVELERETRIDWAWGQARFRNPQITREQVAEILKRREGIQPK
jgi:hypothetical protein